MKPLLSVLALSFLPNCYFADPPKPFAPEAKPSAYRMVRCRTGTAMTLAQAADELAARDVVYFGELHDNVAGHQVYAELAKLLADRRSDFVLSMEMFKRDVQGVVNDYLRGRIDEAAFLKYSRPWKDYARDYRPLVELTRTRKLDVIASNLPRPVAGKVASKEGSISPFLPRLTTAPLDRYWELFVEAMKGHPGVDGAVERMYRAQCAKDHRQCLGSLGLLPEQYGLADLKHETGQAWIGIVRPLAMRYGVFDERRIVMVAAIPVLLPKDQSKPE